ncbi:hypothetical protein QTP86_003373 [Hemibagrus guttatus]|nr:hypothetical protein QTP86_003373 [Hemibagrus guttatus]
MTGTLLYIAVFILLKGSCKGVLITQWPKYISSYKNTSVDMHCYQNDTDYEYTYWYRQIGNELVLITRSVAGSHNQEKGKDKLKFSKDRPILATETSDVTIHCSHDDSTLYNMYSYQQTSPQVIALIGYTVSAAGMTNCVKFNMISSLLVNDTEEVTIQCSHDGNNLPAMLWYQQKSSTVMSLIGYTAGPTELSASPSHAVPPAHTPGSLSRSADSSLRFPTTFPDPDQLQRPRVQELTPACTHRSPRSVLSPGCIGLDPRIQLHLAAYEDSIGLEKFIQLSIRFATRMQLCLEEHQAQPLFPTAPRRPERVSRPEPADEPMDLEHSDLAATERQRERQRRLAQNRCFYCGRSGYFLAECPSHPAQSMATSVESSTETRTPDILACYSRFQDVFCPRKASKLPSHRPWDCAIDLIPGEPVPKGWIYSLSIPEERAMEEYIKEALSQGYIHPSTSPAASSFFFVAKKDGSLRPCIDYRALNQITVKFRYPLPLVPSVLEHLYGATVCTKLDLCSAFNLIRI